MKDDYIMGIFDALDKIPKRAFSDESREKLYDLGYERGKRIRKGIVADARRKRVY